MHENIRRWIVRSMPWIATAAALGCSSKSGTNEPCNEDPWSCPSGQTCWPTTSGAYACLNSGSGQAGSACTNTGGIATCGDGLACLMLTDQGGTCTPYCSNTEASHACPSGEACEMALVQGGTVIQVCVGASAEAGATRGNDAASGNEANEAGAFDAAPSGDGPSAECAAWADRESAQCPGMDETATLDDCAQGESLYDPEGCAQEWSAYAACAAQATYTCSGGPNGCDAQQTAYFSCQSSFTATTTCSRVPGTDARCPASAPFAYGCLAAPPAACTRIEMDATAAMIACCPQFSPM